MKKKGLTKSGGTKAMHQGPVLKTGSGVGGGAVPRCGYPPAGRDSHTRYDQHIDSHSIDKRD